MDDMFQTSFQNDPFSRAARQPAPLAQPRNSVTVEEVGDGEEFTTRSSRPLVEEPDEGTHSSFVSYGGPGGMSFQRTQSARTGPGGVAEYSESYMDGQRGEGTSHHSRFIGDRGRTAQQSWSSNGRNGNQDILHNLDSQAADGFEQEWAGRSSGRLGSQPYGHRQALRGRMH
ncbi:hypothetical protein WJX84_005176 [Apatococcus fuscideae]|uniref:Uncharacterized protein n=1 Tax=Apatococcus fuscideae TaxID=2026836 RepID=A0AAW1T244_9CHLO